MREREAVMSNPHKKRRYNNTADKSADITAPSGFRSRNNKASTAVTFFMLMTIMLHVIALKVFTIAAHTDLLSAYKGIGSKILGAILVLEMIAFVHLTPMRINWEAMKCKREEIVPSLVVSGWISLAVIAALVIFRAVSTLRDPSIHDIPLFGLYLNLNMRYIYPINIVFQEFFIKAFVQENCSSLAFQKVGRHSKGPVGAENTHITVWATSIFFFILHLQYPFYYMIGALILCAVTGYLYEKHHNIWGAVLVHFTLGFLPRCLGVLQILER